MLTRIRQALCLHWFDPIMETSYGEGFGPIVCCEQKTRTVTAEVRVCSRCGLKDSQIVGTEYEGWQR
jgi:hypothetical protein